MITNRSGDCTRDATCVGEQRPRLKDASAGAIAWRAMRGADSRGSGNHVKGEHDRSDRQHPSQESKCTRAMTYDLRTAV